MHAGLAAPSHQWCKKSEKNGSAGRDKKPIIEFKINSLINCLIKGGYQL